MDRQLKERLEKLTPQQREQRFRYLRERHGLENPRPLDGGAPPEMTLEDAEGISSARRDVGPRCKRRRELWLTTTRSAQNADKLSG